MGGSRPPGRPWRTSASRTPRRRRPARRPRRLRISRHVAPRSSTGRGSWLRQVHGSTVAVVDGPDGGAGRVEADASVTATPGVVLSVHTADCAPIAHRQPARRGRRGARRLEGRGGGRHRADRGHDARRSGATSTRGLARSVHPRRVLRVRRRRPRRPGRSLRPRGPDANELGARRARPADGGGGSTRRCGRRRSSGSPTRARRVTPRGSILPPRPRATTAVTPWWSGSTNDRRDRPHRRHRPGCARCEPRIAGAGGADVRLVAVTKALPGRSGHRRAGVRHRRRRRELRPGAVGQGPHVAGRRHRRDSSAMALPRSAATQQGAKRSLRTCSCGRASTGSSWAPRSPSAPRAPRCSSR